MPSDAVFVQASSSPRFAANSSEMTSFGAELHELPLVNTFTQNGIQFVGEVRDFLKERAQIEKEYGHKLDALCKRYLKSRDKTAASLMVDPPGIVDSAPLTEKFG